MDDIKFFDGTEERTDLFQRVDEELFLVSEISRGLISNIDLKNMGYNCEQIFELKKEGDRMYEINKRLFCDYAELANQTVGFEN